MCFALYDLGGGPLWRGQGAVRFGLVFDMLNLIGRYREADKTHGRKYNMGQKQKIRDGSKAENTIWAVEALG